MSPPLRRLWDDLVEKRLWPLALLLVVALVAIPVVVGGAGSGPSGEGDISLAASDSSLPATPVAAVRLVGPPAVRSRPGPVRDPFRRAKPKQPKTAAKTAAKAAASPAKPAVSGSSSKRPSGSSGSAGKGASPATVKPKPTTAVTPIETAADVNARSVYETVAHVTGPHVDYEHPLARLAVVGDKHAPALQYLGVGAGGEYAIFLPGPGASAAGDAGACVVADPCRAIGLREGEKLVVDVAGADASAVPYRIEIMSLRHVRLANRALAQERRDAVAGDGRDVLRTLAADLPTAGALGQLRYLPDSGTVALIGAP